LKAIKVKVSPPLNLKVFAPAYVDDISKNELFDPKAKETIPEPENFIAGYELFDPNLNERLLAGVVKFILPPVDDVTVAPPTAKEFVVIVTVLDPKLRVPVDALSLIPARVKL
jgi:hypothetical protein